MAPTIKEEVLEHARATINLIRTQDFVPPWAALDTTSNVAFGPFASEEDAVDAIKHADFMGDELGPIIGDKGLAALTQQDLEQVGWKFTVLMDVDRLAEERTKSKFIDQPGQVHYIQGKNHNR